MVKITPFVLARSFRPNLWIGVTFQMFHLVFRSQKMTQEPAVVGARSSQSMVF